MDIVEYATISHIQINRATKSDFLTVSSWFEAPAAAQMYKPSSVSATAAHWDGADMK